MAKGLAFRLSHGLLAIFALLASLFHIVGSDFYFKAFSLWAVASILVAVLLLYYAVNRMRQIYSLSENLFGQTDSLRLAVSKQQKWLLFMYLFVFSSLLSGGLYVVTH